MRSPLALPPTFASDPTLTSCPSSTGVPLMKRRRLGPPSEPTLNAPVPCANPAPCAAVTPVASTKAIVPTPTYLQNCVSCNRSLALLPPTQIVRCSRCAHSMCTICSRTCTPSSSSSSSLPSSPQTTTSSPPRPHPTHPTHANHPPPKRDHDEAPARRPVRKLPARRSRLRVPHAVVVVTPVAQPGTGSVDALMEDDVVMELVCDTGKEQQRYMGGQRLRPYLPGDRNKAGQGQKECDIEGEWGEGGGRRHGCGRVVCRGCCVEDVRRGIVGCLDCLSP